MAGMTAIRNYERGLSQRLIRGLLEIHDLDFYGIRDEARFDWRVPTAAIRIRGIPPADDRRDACKETYLRLGRQLLRHQCHRGFRRRGFPGDWCASA